MGPKIIALSFFSWVFREKRKKKEKKKKKDINQYVLNHKLNE